MTDQGHKLVRTVRYCTEAQVTRWSDDGRPFVDPTWTRTSDRYEAMCSCGRGVAGATEGDVLAAFSTHVAYVTTEAAAAVTA